MRKDTLPAERPFWKSIFSKTWPKPHVSETDNSRQLAAVRANSLRGEFADAPEQLAELDLMDALDILFASAHHIFRFYQLRLEARGFTQEMRAIMEQEIRHSERMRNLCLKDSRLGFHSEAENYKFFPEKLEARIAFLKEMLARTLPELPSEIHDISDQWYQADQYTWHMEDTGRTVKIHAVVSNSCRCRVDQMFAAVQGRPETPPVVIGVTKNDDPIGAADGASVKCAVSERSGQSGIPAEDRISSAAIHDDVQTGFPVNRFLLRFNR